MCLDLQADYTVREPPKEGSCGGTCRRASYNDYCPPKHSKKYTDSCWSRLEIWRIKELEAAAATCRGGTRYRFEALVAAVKFIRRVKSLSPEVPESELQAALASPKMLTRVQETLQHRDVEGNRQKMIRSGLSPSRGRGSEALKVLCSYLEHTILALRDAAAYEDVEHVYYCIQEPRLNAEGDDVWWAPGLTYPCGIPGHIHSLAVCEGFWTMAPMNRQRKLHPGSSHAWAPRLCVAPWNALVSKEYQKDYCVPAAWRRLMSGDILRTTPYSVPGLIHPIGRPLLKFCWRQQKIYWQVGSEGHGRDDQGGASPGEVSLQSSGLRGQRRSSTDPHYRRRTDTFI